MYNIIVHGSPLVVLRQISCGLEAIGRCVTPFPNFDFFDWQKVVN